MKFVVLNNKCYLGYNEMINYKKELDKIKTDYEIVLMPNISYLSVFKDVKYSIGAQNFYSYNYGAYTGEVCLSILKDLNVTYTLVGHPERFSLRLDNYEEVKDKLFRSLNSNFKTILCIGKDNDIKLMKKELKYYLKNIENKSLQNMIIAYEPINIEEVNKEDIIYVMMEIKKYVESHFEIDIPFIYGGLVDKETIDEILEITDGVIIGKESSDINTVKEMISKSCK